VVDTKVEIQIRTIAMDFWASLEHKMRYKKNIPENHVKYLQDELYDCARQSAELDNRMQNIRKGIFRMIWDIYHIISDIFILIS